MRAKVFILNKLRVTVKQVAVNRFILSFGPVGKISDGSGNDGVRSTASAEDAEENDATATGRLQCFMVVETNDEVRPRTALAVDVNICLSLYSEVRK